MVSDPNCVFCQIAARSIEADWVLETETVLAFLDRRPLFHGHVLVVPRYHVPNLFEAPPEIVREVFEQVRRLSVAVKSALESDGVFVATNNGVSQSVDHLHIHVVPRRNKDGLRGFMWPRHKYDSAEQSADIAARIAEALESID